MSGASSPVLVDAIDHDLVFVKEFDALQIDVKVVGDIDAGPETAQPLPTKEAKYPAKEHARKVAKQLGVKEGLIYLPGLPTPLFEDSDMGPQFRQRRYFYYLGGADFPDCHVTYDIGKDNLILWIPYIDPRQVLWYGTSPGPEECLAKTDLDDVRYNKGLKKYLRERLDLDAREEVFHVSPAIGSIFCNELKGAFGRETPKSDMRPMPLPLFVLRQDQLPDLQVPGVRRTAVRADVRNLQPAMDHARVIKTPYEIDMIRRANKISSSAHLAVLQRIKDMTNERQIESAFLDHCNAEYGAKHQSYGVIAGSGPNAAVLHYFANDEPLVGRQLVCLDAGAEWELYASDVTRTFPISGTFTPEAAAIYKAVAKMQETVFAQFRPGVPFQYLHLQAASVAASELLRLGILQGGTAGEILSAGTISAFFPHGLGHHVGLEVHDVLSGELMARLSNLGVARLVDYKADRSVREAMAKRPNSKRIPATPEWYASLAAEAVAVSRGDQTCMQTSADGVRRLLEPGMVITVEPGIYFCRSYIESFFLANEAHAKYINRDVLEKYYPVGGVRIEDCLLVTATGHENLTTAPKGDEALKIINGGQ